jgi:hypothetical protein
VVLIAVTGLTGKSVESKGASMQIESGKQQTAAAPSGIKVPDTNGPRPISGEKGLREKLTTIRINDFPVVSPVDLVEVLKELGSQIRRRDPSGRGVNLVISNGSSQGPSGAATIDAEKFQIKFDPPIRDVTLGQFFDALVRVAEPPPGAPPTARLKYSVEDYAIVFSVDLPEGKTTANASVNSAQSSDNATSKSLGVPSPEIPPSSVARQKVIEKLDAIRIDDLPLTSAVDLIEVFKELAHQTRKRDTEGQGINFVIDQTNGRVFNPPIDVGLFQIKIDPPVRNVTLRQLCDIMVRVAKPPDGAPTDATLEYMIADYGVVFGLRANQTEEFVSRTFKIDPNTFLKALDAVLPRRVGTVVNDIPQQVRAFAELAGVSFQSSASNRPDQKKAIFYNDRNGVLYVRATSRELDQIENAIHALNAIPPQVSIHVEAAEISRELKLRIEKEIEMADKTPVLATNEFLFVTAKEASGEPVLMGTKSLRDNISDPVAIARVTFPAIQAVLIPEDARTLRDRLKAAKEVDFLAAPNVTTLVGRQARISVEETRMIVTPKTVKTGGVQAALGPMVDCLAEDFDGVNLRLNCTVNMTEFLEYDRAGDAPLPKFRVRSIGSRTKLAPGSTLAFLMPLPASKRVPVLADIPHLGQLFEEPNDAGRYVLILITPVIIDSAGNMVLPKSN